MPESKPKLTPLNGVKTHPLSAHAMDVLRALLNGPTPRQTINPGVRNRLAREALTEEVSLPSPYAVHKFRDIAFVQITPAGRAALQEADRG